MPILLPSRALQPGARWLQEALRLTSQLAETGHLGSINRSRHYQCFDLFEPFLNEWLIFSELDPTYSDVTNLTEDQNTMRTEAHVIDLSRTESGTYTAPDTYRVIRNTYQLLALSTAVAGVGAGISMLAGFGPLAGILFTLLGLVPLVYLHKKRNTAAAVPAMLTFTGLSGLGLGPTLTHYLSMPGGGSMVLTAAVITTAVTLALTAYVHKTGKDFSRMGGFLFAGLIVVILASIAALFVPAMQAGVSAVAALLFSGFILFDTSRLVRGEEDNYVMAAVSMYLNVLNLFLAVLQLLGLSSND